jgi:hypothetical protein
MKAEYVELVLLEQSLANSDGVNRPFSDRVGDVAEKTDGSVLFDIRVDGDTRIQRLAAVGYVANETVVLFMDKYGQLSSAPVDNGSDYLVDELAAWGALPMAEQARVSNCGAADILLAELRRSGRLGRVP